MSRLNSIPFPKNSPDAISKREAFVRVLGGVALWALLMSGLNIILDIKSYGDDFVLNLIIFVFFPLLALYFREWRVKEMPRHLADSKTLITVPSTIASFTNVFIRYLPWVLLVVSIPLGIDKIFFEGNLWKIYGADSIETLIVLVIFLMGRRHINALNKFRIPKFKAAQLQAFTSYVAPLQLPLLKGLQWIWHSVLLCYSYNRLG